MIRRHYENDRTGCRVSPFCPSSRRLRRLNIPCRSGFQTLWVNFALISVYLECLARKCSLDRQSTRLNSSHANISYSSLSPFPFFFLFFGLLFSFSRIGFQTLWVNFALISVYLECLALKCS